MPVDLWNVYSIVENTLFFSNVVTFLDSFDADNWVFGS